MAEIPLKNGYVALVDECDVDRVMQFTWRALHNPRATTLYAYVQASGERRSWIYLHRFILGAPPGLLVDHRNKNGLDCRRDNLRLATTVQNAASMHSRVGEAGYRGVVPVREKGVIIGYTARMSVGNRGRYLGFFKNAEDAARCRDRAALELHGEFAVLNFPDERAAA